MSDYEKLEAAAIAVLRAASIGDQNFVYCLQRPDAAELRHALVHLADVLRGDVDDHIPDIGNMVR